MVDEELQLVTLDSLFLTNIAGIQFKTLWYCL